MPAFLLHLQCQNFTSAAVIHMALTSLRLGMAGMAPRLVVTKAPTALANSTLWAASSRSEI